MVTQRPRTIWWGCGGERCARRRVDGVMVAITLHLDLSPVALTHAELIVVS